MTFGKRVVLFIHVQKGLSKLKSGKECDGVITLVSGADFRRNDRCFIGFLTLKHFVFSPPFFLKKGQYMSRTGQLNGFVHELLYLYIIFD